MKPIKAAIAGCTGNVGRTILKVLEERQLPFSEVYMFASSKSAGSTIKFNGKDYTILEINEENIKKYPVDIVLMSAGGNVSKQYAPMFAQAGAVVIDNSSQWRMDKAVPLIVPEANPQDINWHDGIIANPNCSTIQAIVALKPLDDAFGIKRVVYSTYQSVSGAGVAGGEDLENGKNGLPHKKFAYPIFNNLIPQIDVFLENGYTKEEDKMIEETKKILHRDDIAVTATTVRVPISNCHSESINVEFFNEAPIEKVFEVLKDAPGLIVMDDPSKNIFPMPITCDDKDEVFVGRIRKDFSVANGINLWVVADNIRKGAATNTVAIAQLLIEKFNS